MAITWRNVEGPNFRDAILAGTTAQQQMNAGFDNFNKILEQETKTNLANWDSTKQNNTEAYYADVSSKFRTPEEFLAAQRSGLLDQMRQQYGAQIDQVGTRKFLEDRPGLLMDRVLKNNDYTDKTREFEERPDRDKVASMIASKDFTGARTELGRLKLRDEASLYSQLSQGERSVVEQGQADRKFTSDLLSADVQRKTALGNLQVARQNAGTNALQARNTGLYHSANLAQFVAQQQNNIVQGVNKQLLELDDKQSKLGKESVFKGGAYKDEYASDLIKVAKDAGIDPGAVGEFLTKFKDTYSKGYIESPDGSVKIPITKGMLETAIIQGAGKFGWGFGGLDSVKGNQIFNSFQGMVENPSLANEYRSFLNESNRIEFQKQAIKEAGQAQISKISGEAQPYISTFEENLSNRLKKTRVSNPFQ